MQAGYIAETTADVALSAATAKTILAVIAAADAPIRLCEFSVSFDGTSATAEPVTVELCLSTQGAAVTSTAFTPVQMRGRTRTVTAAAARNYSAEPTTLTCIKRWLVHPQASVSFQFPLGREPETSVSGTTEAFCLRCTAPAAVNAQAYMEWEEG